MPVSSDEGQLSTRRSPRASKDDAGEFDIGVSAADGRPLAVSVFTAPQPRRLVIVGAATGVRRRYYAAFARWLATRGAIVITFDYRGIGDSARKPLSHDDARMREWGEYDLAGIFEWTSREWPRLAPALVAHSVAGQVAGLAPGTNRCDVLVFVGSTHGYVANWPWWMRPYLHVLWRGLLPASTRLRGYFPSRWFALGEPLPAGVGREWAAWCRDPGYLFGPRFGLDTSRYPDIKARLVSWSFSDDLIAPRRAVDALVLHYPGAAVVRRHVHSHREIGRRVGHFGFFRPANRQPLWEQAAVELGV